MIFLTTYLHDQFDPHLNAHRFLDLIESLQLYWYKWFNFCCHWQFGVIKGIFLPDMSLEHDLTIQNWGKIFRNILESGINLGSFFSCLFLVLFTYTVRKGYMTHLWNMRSKWFCGVRLTFYCIVLRLFWLKHQYAL